MLLASRSMAQLVVGASLQQISLRDGWKAKDIIDWLVENNEPIPAHTKPLTVKADGVLLNPSQRLPKDAMTIEVVETFDEEVTTKGDSGPETVSQPELSSDSGDNKR